MKKQFLLFAAAALILTSCGNENTENQGQTQAQIDSAVNAQVAEREAEMARKNDSTLKAMEAEKAAAEAAAAEEAAKKSSGKKTTKTKKEEPAAPAPPPPPPPTVGNGKPKMGGTPTDANKPSDGTIGNGKPKMGK
jgi:septal ring factor EnvC (AmiA/AmiB activator)